MQLSDLYDADQARTDPAVAALRGVYPAPHPLREVQYADGVWRDSTAGRVFTRDGRRVAKPTGRIVYGRDPLGGES